MKQLTIKNCTLVNEGSLLESDVLIKNGRIEKIEASIDEEGDFIDAKGLHLLPGFIDDQVHFSCLLYTSPSPRDATLSRMPSSA